ncbi:hypothetical protein OMP38_16290 [Cohnella ginsengisoli]|uniref:Uncharacterized protein n=1 Tax=Cohnella ginsengisoli TaxID=425004 RepID=A0A9X4KHT5_9BACL|nr:hypothetical protein [Cohnella ginsengisoli]MDG0792253.1 hypothetical protein [Cohnella ginsengisoli]
MASLHTGSPNRAVELLRIETNWFDLYLQGKSYHPAVESLQLHRQEDAGWVEAQFYPQSLMPELELSSVAVFDPEIRALKLWAPGDVCAPVFF